MQSVILVLASILTLSGCTFVCSSEARSGIALDIVDAETGEEVAATVTIAEGDYVEVLGPEDGYAGAWERAGVYEVEVIAVGYEPASRSGVRVEEGDCHVEGVRLEIALQPAP